MSAYSDLILGTTGLVAYWRLGDASGDATAAFGGITGTPTALTYGRPGAITGDTDTAFGFDGATKSKVDFGNTAAVQLSTGSAEAWFRTDAITGTGAVVVKANAYGLFINNNHLAWYSWGGGDPGFREDDVNVVDGAWHHAVFAFESGASNGSFIYLDGALSHTATMNVGDQAVNLSIGKQMDFDNLFTGDLDEVAIYSTKLDAATVLAHYEMGVNGPAAGGNSSVNRFQSGQRRQSRILYLGR